MAMLALARAHVEVAGVRDVRCYAAALLWVPAISGVLFGNVSIPLALALGVRLAVSRRDMAASVRDGAGRLGQAPSSGRCTYGCCDQAISRGCTCARDRIVVTFGAWAVIGFAGLGGYPDLLRRLSDIQSERSYSFVGIAASLGIAEAVGQVVHDRRRLGLLVCLRLYSRGAARRCARSRAQWPRRSR